MKIGYDHVRTTDQRLEAQIQPFVDRIFSI